MNAFTLAGQFLPEEALPLVLAAAGIAYIVGARGIAFGLIAMVLAAIIVPVVLEPLFALLPMWVLLLLMVYIGLVTLQTVLVVLFGKHAGNEAFGHILAVFVLNLLTLPFHAMRWLYHGIRWLARAWA